MAKIDPQDIPVIAMMAATLHGAMAGQVDKTGRLGHPRAADCMCAREAMQLYRHTLIEANNETV